MEVLDPLWRGGLGAVREADAGARRVVVKEIQLHGVSAHLVRERMGTVQDELVRAVGVLCMLAHPNVHPYTGVCVHQGEAGPPYLALVQDFCHSTLDRFLAKHNAPHSPSVTLPLSTLNDVARTLDRRGSGRISQVFLSHCPGLVTHIKESSSISRTRLGYAYWSVWQAAFLEGLAREPWIADLFKLPKRARDRWAARQAAAAAPAERKRLSGHIGGEESEDAGEAWAEEAEADECLEFIWCEAEDGALDERLPHQHEFGRVDRDAARAIDLSKLAAYFGPRELPGVRIAWAQRIQIALAVARGMQYLAACGIAHGNLKSANVAVVHNATPASVTLTHHQHQCHDPFAEFKCSEAGWMDARQGRNHGLWNPTPLK